MKNLEKEFKSSNQDVDLYEYYQALTLDTICRTALGVKYEIQNNIEHSEILRHVKVLFSNKMNLLTVLFGELKTEQTSLTTPACTHEGLGVIELIARTNKFFPSQCPLTGWPWFWDKLSEECG